MWLDIGVDSALAPDGYCYWKAVIILSSIGISTSVDIGAGIGLGSCIGICIGPVLAVVLRKGLHTEGGIIRMNLETVSHPDKKQTNSRLSFLKRSEWN